MTDAPAPLTAPGTDLRDFGFMPLDVVRLRDSDLASGDDLIFRVCVLSWCASWHQVPAASLPDDDAALARLLGFGRDMKGWKRARAAGALRGWITCSDGRLYHPVVAEKANEAWKGKRDQRSRTEAARKARDAQRQAQSHALSDPLSQSMSQSPRDRDRDSKGTGTGRTTEPPAPADLFAPDPSATSPAIAIPFWLEVGGKDPARAEEDRTSFRELVVKYPATRHIGENLSRKLSRKVYVRELVAAVLEQTSPGAQPMPGTTPTPRPPEPLDHAIAILKRDGFDVCRERTGMPSANLAEMIDDLSDNPGAVDKLIAASGKAVA